MARERTQKMLAIGKDDGTACGDVEIDLMKKRRRAERQIATAFMEMCLREPVKLGVQCGEQRVFRFGVSAFRVRDKADE